MLNKISRIAAAAVVILSTSALCSLANATIVQFQTSMGDFEVNLYDQTTPETVANFLTYIEADAYTDTIIHRSMAGFVVQGGGFSYTGTLPIEEVQTNPPVVNEPKYSNVRATIAMAKLADKPNSATSQWFINLSNNSATLDGQNGGFTVFGEVMLDGMDIVDAMAAVPVYSAAPFTHMPLRDFDNTANTDPDETNFIMINSIVVLDAAEDTAADADPAPITDPGPVTDPTPVTPKKKKSGGSTGLLELLAILALAVAATQKTLIRKLNSQ